MVLTVDVREIVQRGVGEVGHPAEEAPVARLGRQTLEGPAKLGSVGRAHVTEYDARPVRQRVLFAEVGPGSHADQPNHGGWSSITNRGSALAAAQSPLPDRTTILRALAAAALGRRTTSVPFFVSAAIARRVDARGDAVGRLEVDLVVLAYERGRGLDLLARRDARPG